MIKAIAVTIAGSDSGGGAGIEGDLKTFSALATYGACVITALTAQNTREVSGVYDIPADFITAQIDAVFSDLKVLAVKIGMVSRVAAIEAIAAGLDRHHAPNIVLDPVMIAGTGARLLAADAVEALRRGLVPRARIITPNLPEAAALLDEPIAQNEAEMRDQAERLLALGPSAVILKGGHAAGPESVDIFVDGACEIRLPAPRLEARNTHGTGCALSAAIAAGLARGLPLPEAVAEAKTFVTNAIRAADRLQIGAGPGPVHHFFDLW